MLGNLSVVAFDADDTLWHNERFFQLTQARFSELLRDHCAAQDLDACLLAAERRNIGRYGYGIKGFMLSMIETAVEVTQGRVEGHVIQRILDAGHEMLEHPIELLPFAKETIEAVAQEYDVLLITKGDLLDQERKLAQSGLGDHFDGVEIVSEKTAPVYGRIFDRFGGGERALMVGNSMRSDIVPVLEVGGWAAHVPHDLAWELEHAERPENAPRFVEIENLSQVPALIERIHSV